MGRRSAKRKKKRVSKKSERVEIHVDELKGIIERAKGALSEEDCGKLEAAVDTLVVLTRELETKGTTIRRLRKMLFGSGTEKTKIVLGDSGSDEPEASEDEADTSTGSGDAEPGQGNSAPRMRHAFQPPG